MQYFFMILLFFATLRAEEKDPYLLAVTEGEPSALVEGIVSAITGDLYLNKGETVIEGHVPLRLPLAYVSGKGENELSGWTIPNHFAATYSCPEHDSEDHFITIKHLNGASFTYRGSGARVSEMIRKKPKKRAEYPRTRFSFPNLSQLAGITNTASGFISGATNFKNAYIELDHDAEYFTLYCPDGTQYGYKRAEHSGSVNHIFKGDSGECEYLLQWERLPDKNMICYDYKGKEIASIRSTNPDTGMTYAQANFYPEKGKHTQFLAITTSDGKSVDYHFEKNRLGTDWIKLTAVHSTAAPAENISYYDHIHSGAQIKRVSTDDHRCFEVDYYEYKQNKELKKDPSNRSKVKYLKAPIGQDPTPIITHQFFYNTAERYTDVREIDNKRTRYRYNEKLRLEQILRYDANEQLINQERFRWNEEGFLLSRSFLDNQEQPFFTRTFSYDQHGNVVEETLTGNLSGQEGAIENYTIKYQYREGNLLIRKEEPNGKITFYNYVPNTNLVATKFIYDRDRLKIRTFYEYNDQNVLIREITDDGSDEKDGSNITTRLIKEMYPVLQRPYLNMPHFIEEKYWDGKDVHLLKKAILTYTTGGRIAQKDIFDADGNYRYSLRTEYNNLGKPTLETNALGQGAVYSYDSLGNQTFTENVHGKRTCNTYDFSNRMTQTNEIAVGGVQKPTTYFYDQKHRKIASVDPFGQQTRYVYDSFGNLAQTHLPATLDAQGNRMHAAVYNSYDEAGRVTAQTDAKGYTTHYQYNARSQITAIFHPDGTEERNIYNLDGTLRTHIDVKKTQTDYVYDIFDRVMSKTVSYEGETLQSETNTYNSFHLIATTDEMGNTTTYEYDRAGRKIAEEIQGERTEYTYDALGRVHMIRTGDQITITEHDLLDRVIERRIEDSSGDVLHHELYAYDHAGNLISTTRFPDNQPAIERTRFDGFNRFIEHFDPMGTKTYTYYEDQFIDEYQQRVLRKTTVDALGLTIVETFDTHGRLHKLEKKLQTGSLLKREEYFYDLNANLSRHVATSFHASEAPSSIVTLWEYAAMNRLMSHTEAAGTDQQKTTKYTYTSTGELYQIIKPDGVVLEHRYDPLGQLIELTSSDGSIHNTFQYDKIGQQIQSSDLVNNATIHRTYDALGRVLQEDCNQLTVDKTYDSLGRCIRIQLPDRSGIHIAYDALYCRSIDRISQEGEVLYTHYYNSYDKSGHNHQQTLVGKAGELVFSPNPRGRITRVDSNYGFSELEYDIIGNVTAEKTANRQTVFQYDPLYQLLHEERSIANSAEVQRQDYGYDFHHNRLKKNEAIYTLNALHQIPSEFQYDANGNPISDGTVSYKYDALDRLVQVETPTHRYRYTYDTAHRRLSSSCYLRENEEWTKQEELYFLYDGDKEIGAVDGSGNIVELRVIPPEAFSEQGQAVALEFNGIPYVPVHDLFGNVELLLDFYGNPVESYFYTAFGEEEIFDRAHNGILASQNPWRFASKRTDPTGLVYYGKRYYIPTHGRWLTQDPAGYTDGFNLYAFLMNNPLDQFDLFGLAAETRIKMSPWGAIETVSFDPIKELSTQEGYKSLHQWSNWSDQFWPESRSERSSSAGVSHTRNIGVAIMHGIGSTGVGMLTGVADIGQLISAPFYYAVGQGATWHRHWNALQLSNSYNLSQVDQWMQTLLPQEQKAAYYDSLVFYGTKPLAEAAVIVAAVGKTAIQVIDVSASTIRWGEKTISSIAKTNHFFERGADSLNAALNLSRKLSRLEKFQQNASRTRILSDGRIRYYDVEVMSRTSGPTRGACNVLEWNLKTGRVRSWYECYDYLGNVNRVHPKTINGQVVKGLHYPPTKEELIK
jgi:RHS repeat-associated protein